MSAVLAELEKRQAARQAALVDRWWATVKAIGNGEPTDTPAVEQLLADLGRTPSELAAQVGAYQQRKALYQVAAGERDWEREYKQATLDAAALNAEWQRVQQEFAHKGAALNQRQANAAAAIQQAIAAREKLVKECPYPDVRERVEAAEVPARQARRQAEQLRGEARRLEQAAEANASRRNHDAAQRQQEQAAAKVAEAKGLEAEADRLEAEGRTARAELMEP